MVQCALRHQVQRELLTRVFPVYQTGKCSIYFPAPNERKWTGVHFPDVFLKQAVLQKHEEKYKKQSSLLKKSFMDEHTSQ